MPDPLRRLEEEVRDRAIPDEAWRHRRWVPARVVLGERPQRRMVRGAPVEPRIDPRHLLEVDDLSEIRGRPPWVRGEAPGWTEPPDAGEHAGKGPRGWMDERLHDVICLEMLDDPDLDATELEVACQDGEVTLTGWVRSRDEKRLAEWIADHTRGVRDVHNRLVVR
jgi:hypothetical protein